MGLSVACRSFSVANRLGVNRFFHTAIKPLFNVCLPMWISYSKHNIGALRSIVKSSAIFGGRKTAYCFIGLIGSICSIGSVKTTNLTNETNETNPTNHRNEPRRKTETAISNGQRTIGNGQF